MLTITNYDLYLFDLQGYLYLENVIPELLLSQAREDVAARNRRLISRNDNYRYDLISNGVELYRSFLDLIDLSPLFAGKEYRLDHDYLQILKRGRISSRLHGGNTPKDFSQVYECKDGEVFNSLLAVSFNLTSSKKEEGGFVCIPGSHKSNFPCPNKDTSTLNSLVKGFDVNEGSCFIFTEALTHGTRDWVGNQSRANYFVKYSPFFMRWSKKEYVFEHKLVNNNIGVL